MLSTKSQFVLFNNKMNELYNRCTNPMSVFIASSSAKADKLYYNY